VADPNPRCTCFESGVIDVLCPVHGAPLPDPPLPPVTQPTAGYRAVPLSRQTALPNHWGDPKPDPDAFRCPYCGMWRPGYLFNGQRALLPPTGMVDYLNVLCQECRVLLQIIITGFDPGLGRRTH